MKVVYDPQIYTIQNIGGISRYFTELISNLDILEGVETCVPLKFSNNIYISGWDKSNHKSFFPNTLFKGKRRSQLFLNKFFFSKALEEIDYEIIHPTYYDDYFIPSIKHRPIVVTVHDMIHERLPSFFPKNDNTSKKKKELVNRADRIIAISNNTKNDIINFFGVKEKKIEVVYHGGSIRRKTDLSGNSSIFTERDYILFVGRRDQYKNFTRFVKAIAPLMLANHNLHLVCGGGTRFTKAEHELFDNLGIKNKTHQYYLNDRMLSIAYAKASCFVFPSLYEGFGLPLIEAFNEGCPVVCSYSGSMPEIAKDGAIYFDPMSESDIRASVKHVLEDETVKKNIIKKGFARAKDFSWLKTAKETKAVYDMVI